MLVSEVLLLNFEDLNYIEMYFKEFSLQNRWSRHVTKVVSYFLVLLGINYEFMNRMCHVES